MESKILRWIEPLYPEITTAKQLQINLNLEVTVDEQGMVQSVRVLHGHPLLDESSLVAVKQWKFTPTYLNGIPVKVVFDRVLPYRQPRLSRR
jgi:TonB family protein